MFVSDMYLFQEQTLGGSLLQYSQMTASHVILYSFVLFFFPLPIFFVSVEIASDELNASFKNLLS